MVPIQVAGWLDHFACYAASPATDKVFFGDSSSSSAGGGTKSPPTTTRSTPSLGLAVDPMAMVFLDLQNVRVTQRMCSTLRYDFAILQGAL